MWQQQQQQQKQQQQKQQKQDWEWRSSPYIIQQPGSILSSLCSSREAAASKKAEPTPISDCYVVLGQPMKTQKQLLLLHLLLLHLLLWLHLLLLMHLLLLLHVLLLHLLLLLHLVFVMHLRLL